VTGSPRENRRSLGYARDDKGEGSAHLNNYYRGMDRAALDLVIPTGAKRSGGICGSICRHPISTDSPPVNQLA